jgi:hypothetical protein
MTSPSTTAGPRGVPRGWLLAAGLVALSYSCTSLVVVVNALGNATGVVWLPSFPAGYYRVSLGGCPRINASSSLNPNFSCR